MKRIALLMGFGVLLVASSYAQQNEPRFTGKSVAMEGKDLSAARRSFGVPTNRRSNGLPAIQSLACGRRC